MAHLSFSPAPRNRLEEAAGCIDAVRHEQGVATATLQAIPRLHVQQDVRHDLTDAVQRAGDLAHGAPFLPELCAGQIAEALGLGVKPLIDLRLGGDVLIDVPRLVAQVQDHSVTHRFVVLVGVDVRPEGLDAARLVGLEERRAGEADEGRAGEDGLHGPVQFAGLGPMTFVHEDEDLAGRPRACSHVAPEFVHVAVDIAVLGAPELVDERTDQRPGRVV